MAKHFLKIFFYLVLVLPGLGYTESIVLLGSDNLPPKSYMDGNTPKGYAVDASRAVLKEAGYQVNVQLTPWARAVEEAKAGKGILTHVSKTAEREKIFEFSQPVVFDRIVVVVKKGKEFPFSKPKDLLGKTVGVLRGATYGGEWSEAVKTLNVEYDTDAVARIGKLMRGRIDAAIISSGKAGLKIAVDGNGYDMGDFTILPVPVIQDPNHLVIAKDAQSAKKMAVINEAIHKLHTNGTIDRIMQNYGEHK